MKTFSRIKRVHPQRIPDITQKSTGSQTSPSYLLRRGRRIYQAREMFPPTQDPTRDIKQVETGIRGRSKLIMQTKPIFARMYSHIMTASLKRTARRLNRLHERRCNFSSSRGTLVWKALWPRGRVFVSEGTRAAGRRVTEWPHAIPRRGLYERQRDYDFLHILFRRSA